MFKGAVRSEFLNVITSTLFLEMIDVSDRRQPYIHHCLPYLIGYAVMLADVCFRD